MRKLILLICLLFAVGCFAPEEKATSEMPDFEREVLEEEIRTLRKRLQELEAELTSKKSESDEFKAEIADLREEIERLHEEIAGLEQAFREDFPNRPLPRPPIPPLVATCDPERVAAVTDAEIEGFLKSFGTLKRGGHIEQWIWPPEYRFADNTSEHHRKITREALFRINQLLPPELHIWVGEDTQPGTAFVPDGEIHHEQAPLEEWIWFDEDDPVFLPSEVEQEKEYTYAFAATGYGDSKGEIIAYGRTWIAPSAETEKCPGRHPDDLMLKLIVHETLHHMGLAGHSWEYDASDTVMGYVYCPKKGETVPGLLDCAALKRIYELEQGTKLDDISEE